MLSPEREALRAAIEAQKAAQKNLDDAKVAASKARDRWFAADRKVDERIEQIEEAEQVENASDRIVATLASTDDLDVATLERPIAELKAQLEAAKHEADAWLKARNAAEQAIPIRQQALDWAIRRVNDAVQSVMANEINIAAMLCAAEEARAAYLDRHCELMALSTALNDQCKPVERFLADPWLLVDWQDRPSAQRIVEKFAALKADADAPVEAS